ncbi:hypothetical protein ACF0H5_013671 [Mactra antiquata]
MLRMATKWSYAHTPVTASYIRMYKSNTEMLKHWADQFPEKEAFVEYDIKRSRYSITCKRLMDESAGFARFLVKSGIKKGDIVVISMRNTLNTVVAIMGSQLAGAIPTCYSTQLSDASDMILFTNDINAKLLILESDLECKMSETFKEIISLPKEFVGIIFTANLSSFTFFDIGNRSLQQVMFDSNEEVELPSVLPEDTSSYYVTSGSTGKPKLVEHCHATWLTTTRLLNDIIMADETSRFFCDRPFGWTVGSCRTFLASGTTRIFIDTSVTLEENRIELIADIIQRERCTHVYLPRYLIHDLVKSDDLVSSFSTVKTILTAGERVTSKIQTLHGTYCQRLVVWYGSTELGGVSTFYSDTSSDYIDGVIGKPMPGVEMKVVNDHGDVVPCGERGEVMVRSVYRFRGYLNMTEKFIETVSNDNWVHTDDVGFLNDGGNFVIEGRKNEAMSIGSVKVYPIEVEKVLRSIPEVMEAVVIPVPDARLMNAICACVVIKSAPSHIDSSNIYEHFQKYWNEHSIYKPKYFLLFDKLPIQSTGKIALKSIAQQAIVRLKLQ